VSSKALKDFFNRASLDYGRFAEQKDFVIPVAAKIIPLMKGRVLDVGSGCVLDFKEGVFDQYIALDISIGMLQGLPSKERVEAVCGDAYTLPFKSDSFDFLIYQSVLHHLNPEGVGEEEMERRVKEVLLEARRVTNKNGRLVVVEPCFPPILERMEVFFSPLIQWVMKWLGLPYVFLFSIRKLSFLLHQGGWNHLKPIHIKGTGKKGDWIAPIVGLPSLKIPRGLSPSKIYIIEGMKG
jgi:SAM-dependent methyltransferase